VSQVSPLCAAIDSRQCTRSEYDGRSVVSADLKLLEDAASGRGGDTLFLMRKGEVEAVGEYVAQGNMAQLGDRQFVDELTDWIRFNAAEAVQVATAYSVQRLAFQPSRGGSVRS
jgi:hypothetical protein